MGEVLTRYHVSLDVADKAGVLAAVANVFARHDVSIATVRQSGRDASAQLVIVTHTAPDAALAGDRRGPARTGHRPLGGQRAARRGGRVIAMNDRRSSTEQRHVARSDRGVSGPASGRRGDRGDHAPRGQHAARTGAGAVGARTGCEVYLKVEGANPTGSFKDRGMTVAVSRAVEDGAKAIICASTGNTSALGGGLRRPGRDHLCAVLVPQSKIALGKLAQALVHGARLLQVTGNFDDCLALASKLALDFPVALVNSVNPDRLHGQKTAAFEIVEALGDAPDIHCLPVGNAGNICRVLDGLHRGPRGRQRDPDPEDVRLPGRRRGADRDRPGGHRAVDDRDRDPDRQPGIVDEGDRRPGRVRRH